MNTRVRFTVHYNLCVGTIIGLGNDDQIKALKPMQDAGELGCFSLTESFAGVNSGFIVNTTADWDSSLQSFVLNSANIEARKNWISQGLVADKTVVVADLRISGKSYGPHAFVMDLRRNGEVVSGVSHGDMGVKTVGNDLDNAWISFSNVKLPKSALLNRYGDVVVNSDGSAEYKQKVKGMPVFHMIGQRLFTGRVAVAQAALAFRRGIFNSTKDYTDKKLCWSPKGKVPLSSIPQLQSLYEEAFTKASLLESFVNSCEAELCAALRNNQAPSVELVEAIAVAKVMAVEESIDLTHRLRNEVGSYALMKSSGFGQTDFLQCCKFAEGDSRILMQKMARDRMKLFGAGKIDRFSQKELDQCRELNLLLEADVKENRAESKNDAWDLRWREVYGLAYASMEAVISTYLSSKQE
jgi:acyl-CoA oxidase